MLALAACTMLAQEKPPAPERPRIALALAGGSALGLAHVGVIQWLEEHRIPIDGVAGTSMGGLVGGLYATGADAAQMREFLEAVDWASALQPGPPFRQLAFRRKEDRRAFPNRLEFGLKNGIQLPSALSAGHAVGLVLSRIAAQYPDLGSFDDLPTPFRCIATDLVDSTQVVFDRGDLFDALRATMSLPALFAPVRTNGRVLVDGGVIDNLPVGVARSMNASIVVAVALHANLPRKADGYNLLSVAGRSLDILVKAGELHAMAEADIVVIPDFEGMAATDFYRVSEFIERGYAAAEKKANILMRFQLPEPEWQAYRARRAGRRKPARAQPKFVQVDGLTPPLARNLEQRMQPLLNGDLNIGRLNQELTRITGLGRWEGARYSLVEENGQQGLAIHVREKPHGPPFLNTGITIDGGTSQTLRFGIGGRLTFLDVGNPGSEWRTDFAVGNQDVLLTELFHRFRSSKLFFAPRAFLGNSSRDLYDGRRRTARFTTREFGAAFDVGYAAGRFSEFRLGYQISQFRNAVSIGLSALPSLRGNVSRFRARYAHEGQDNPGIATHGIRVTATGQWVLQAPSTDRNFPILEADLRWARPVRGPYFVYGQFAGGSTIHEKNLYDPFTLGGPLRLSALAPQQIFGSHYYFTQLGVLRRITNDPLSMFARVYLTAAWEMGAAFQDRSKARPFHNGTAGFAGETAIGVLFLGGAWGEQGQKKLFFRLGRYF
ncbi:MAG: patatin-like phospholipase family protein [Bryobacteraceae bacterium]